MTPEERAMDVVRTLMAEGVHGWDVAHHHLLARAIDAAVAEARRAALVECRDAMCARCARGIIAEQTRAGDLGHAHDRGFWACYAAPIVALLADEARGEGTR